MGIPKKVSERLQKSIPKYRKILENANSRDINEADTVSIVKDILSDVFGYDKYQHVTSEYAIRNTYCDIAVKIDGEIQFLIEVKAIGISLKDPHLQQVINYGANKGVQWVILTNALQWQLHRIRFEKPIEHEHVLTLNLLDLNPRIKDTQEKLYLLSKEGVGKSIRKEYYEKVQSVNRFVIAAIMQSDSITNLIRRDLRKISPGIKVELSEIEKIISEEVLKRDVLDGEEVKRANSLIKKAAKKAIKKKSNKKAEERVISQNHQTFRENE